MLPPSKGPSTHCYTQYPQPCSRPSGPITSWQIDGEILERVTDFIFLDPEITADGDQMVTAAMKLKDAYSLEEKL